MVDFKKKLAKEEAKKSIIPSEIYEKLDRESDKGPLRPAQKAVLKKWHEQYRDKNDVILKLHTGQGKTLTGLLMLLSKISETNQSAVYVCPNNFLLKQTFIQAKQFGITCRLLTDDVQSNYTDSPDIYLTTAQKLFNGLTQFGIGRTSLNIPTILLDDAHSCIEVVKDSFKITVNYQSAVYQEILGLFSTELEEQGPGTLADIKQHSFESFLPVPYWAWTNCHTDVAAILAKHKDTRGVKFAWPLIKNVLKDCLCVISGSALEIAPYYPPLFLYGSFFNAKHRIFMSATISDDSFLVKGLGLSEEAIFNPLTYTEEKWAGEKMILIPSLIDESLTREVIISEFGQPVDKRKFGTVALCPSFNLSKPWRAAGSVVATTEDIEGHVQNLKNGNCADTVVLANRYDGVDLPDRSCRLLFFDSKPYSEDLLDRYMADVRHGSELIDVNTTRQIEQGLGRAVRGEKDYCSVMMIGADLVSHVRSKGTRGYFSPQTQAQIEIGLEIAEMAKEDIRNGAPPIDALKSLIRQSLLRDDGWKDFYVTEMNKHSFDEAEPKAIKTMAVELAAEKSYQSGDGNRAAQILQKIVDESAFTDSEKGWYLQEMARYMYTASKTESNKLQVQAHRKNQYLLKPKTGVTYSKITIVSQKRVENIINRIKQFDVYEELILHVDNILSNLKFGIKADAFEHAFNEIGCYLGFETQRPDKGMREGPDNLWAVEDGLYLLVECKTEVLASRTEIYKDETGQMNNACAWFKSHYPGATAKKIMALPTRKIGKAAGFNEEVEIMVEKGLKRFCGNVRAFFAEFKSLDFNSLAEGKVQSLLDLHDLSVPNLLSKYSEKPISS